MTEDQFKRLTVCMLISTAALIFMMGLSTAFILNELVRMETLIKAKTGPAEK